MTVEELIGPPTKSISSAPDRVLPSGALFWAGEVPAYPFVATAESLAQVARFIHTFPLAVTWDMSENDIANYVLDPGVVFIEIGQALVMVDEINLGLSAHSGFLFWDKKVSGNEKLLREAYGNIVKMLHLERIQCNVPALNRIMWRMLEKIGFEPEGRLRNAFRLKDGRLTDILIYGALAEELS